MPASFYIPLTNITQQTVAKRNKAQQKNCGPALSQGTKVRTFTFSRPLLQPASLKANGFSHDQILA
jgi:hypothetical protein